MIALATALGLLTVATGDSPWRAHAAEPSRKAPARRVPVIYQRVRSFRLPFNIDAKGRSQLKEIQLWVSEDSGFNWVPRSRTTPDGGTFAFRTNRDGEYWFAVRTVTVDDKYSPSKDEAVEPSMKVIIDTVPPSLVLEAAGRRGSMAAVRWDVKDEHVDIKTLVIEYQNEGARDWRRVPIRDPKLSGAQKWDAGTADGIKVRATVTDRAGNVAENEIVLPEGSAGPADLAQVEQDATDPPPVEQISEGPTPGGAAAEPESPIAAGPGFPPVDTNLATDSVPARTVAGPGRAYPKRARRESPNPEAPGTFVAAGPGWGSAADGRDSGGARQARPAAIAPAPAPGPANGFPNPFPVAESGAADGFVAANSFPAAGGAAGPSAAASGGPENRTMPVASPHFKLQYEVLDAGPSGLAIVELWITRDGGRSWIRLGEDPDKVSPFDVDLGGEGTFGLTLVSRSPAGLGDLPPASGDLPQKWVEVDSTPPTVQLDSVRIGTGTWAGKIALTWRASDLHLPPRPVSLFWRPEQSGAAWVPIADNLEAVGQYVWSVPPTCPARFHLRVEAVDTVGHRSGAETTERGPIIVDRSRPRSRITGLEPNARAGDGPWGRNLR